MSKVSELKKLFDNKQGATLTPEQHALALRANTRDQRQSISIAKSRAARFNLKLRSIELDTQKRESVVVFAALEPPPLAAAKDTPQQQPQAQVRRPGSIYNNNRKSLHTTPPKMAAQIEASHAILSAAMEQDVRPETAMQAMELAARPVVEEAEEEEAEVPVVVQAQEEDVAASPAAASSSSATNQEGASFQMAELVKALEDDDANAINKAVVVEFLQEHAPSEVSNVDSMLHSHAGNEDVLMNALAERYADPVEAEIQAVLHVQEEEQEAATAPAAAAAEEEVEADTSHNNIEGNDDGLGALERQRRDAERARREEEAKIAAMDEAEKALYKDRLLTQAKHNEDRDRMLKSQLNVYGSGGAAALLGGRGRGAGRVGGRGGGNAAAASRPAQQEYIVSAEYQQGKWVVNQ